MIEVLGLMAAQLFQAFNTQHDEVRKCRGADIAEVTEMDSNRWHLLNDHLTGDWLSIDR